MCGLSGTPQVGNRYIGVGRQGGDMGLAHRALSSNVNEGWDNAGISGETCCIGPIAGAQGVAEGAHTGVVGGARGKTCELNFGGFCCEEGDGVRGEVSGCTILVLPYVAVGGTRPAQRGGSRACAEDVDVGGLMTHSRHKA